jgi:hypothetical protein
MGIIQLLLCFWSQLFSLFLNFVRLLAGKDHYATVAVRRLRLRKLY